MHGPIFLSSTDSLAPIDRDDWDGIHEASHRRYATAGKRLTFSRGIRSLVSALTPGEGQDFYQLLFTCISVSRLDTPKPAKPLMIPVICQYLSSLSLQHCEASPIPSFFYVGLHRWQLVSWPTETPHGRSLRQPWNVLDLGMTPWPSGAMTC